MKIDRTVHGDNLKQHHQLVCCPYDSRPVAFDLRSAVKRLPSR